MHIVKNKNPPISEEREKRDTDMDELLFHDENSVSSTELDNGITTSNILEKVVSRISYAPSCINLSWSFETKDIFDYICDQYTLCGWLIRTTFTRPDTNTGMIGKGYGRWEFIPFGASSDYAIKTCWVLLDMIIKHELMEMFEVDGKKIFNPHKSIEELKDK